MKLDSKLTHSGHTRVAAEVDTPLWVNADSLCAPCLSAKSPKWQFSKRWDARTLRGRKEETCVTLFGI